MASPHVAGIAALMLGEFPEDELPRLSASVSKERGRMVTSLSWELLGAPAHVLRDGATIATVNGDTHVDRTGLNGPQPFLYQVCDTVGGGTNRLFAAQVTAQVEPPLAEVVVTGAWSGTFEGSGSCTTDQTGRCTFDLGRTAPITTAGRRPMV